MYNIELNSESSCMSFIIVAYLKQNLSENEGFLFGNAFKSTQSLTYHPASYLNQVIPLPSRKRVTKSPRVYLSVLFFM